MPSLKDDAEEVPAGWIGRSEAIKRSRTVARTFSRREAKGDFTGLLVGGRKWYDPSEIDRVFLDEHVDEEDPMAQTIARFNQSQAQANAHIERLLNLALSPHEKLWSQAQTLIAAQARRIEEYESRHVTMIELLEQLLTNAHERELDRARAQNAERRKDEAFQLVQRHGPVLLEQLTGVHGFKTLARSLTAAQIDQLLGPESPLTEAQREALLGMLEPQFREPEDNNAKKSETDNPGSNGASDRARSAR